MSKTKSRLTEIFSFRDILLILVAWAVKQLLDFLWGKAKTIRFEGKINFRHYLLVMFGEQFLTNILGMLKVFSENWLEQKGLASEYQEYVRIFLEFHRKYHLFVGNKLCRVCLNIIAFRSHLEKYVSDPKLYPPFNF